MEELQRMGLRALGRGLGVRQESISRSICHGMTRINTERKNKQKQKISHGKLNKKVQME